MSDNDPNKTPVEHSANENSTPALGLGDNQSFQQTQQKNTRVLWGIFSLLLLLVLGVIFVLPRLISPPDLSTATVTVVPTITPAQQAANQVSPFEEAQRLRLRETAQNTLASLLELQESLDEKQVGTWNPEQYNASIEQARLGDEAYRQQEFVTANDYYQNGLAILQALETDLPEMYTRFMAEGNAAVLNNDPVAAEFAFSVAVLIDPDSAAAVDAYDRAQILPQVLEQLRLGQEQHEQNQLEAAREYYRQALAFDSLHAGANQALTQVNADILERDFSSAMSQGYTSLRADAPEQAKAAFERALALRPGSSDALAALEQASDQITSSAINIHLQAAQTFEANENWQQALEEYMQALAIDPNVVTVIEGRNRSNSRNNLDIFLTATIEDPLRLAEDEIYDQVSRVYNDAMRIVDPGPKLQGQLQQIRQYLAQVQQPAVVQLQSDGLTNVTLYRISELGMFTSHSLNLLPGHYVAVGVRAGYRDVRAEFTVDINGQSPVVTVQCEELI